MVAVQVSAATLVVQPVMRVSVNLHKRKTVRL
nr:MAG TPA: hypothetical protein [Bacteriophage sp.]